MKRSIHIVLMMTLFCSGNAQAAQLSTSAPAKTYTPNMTWESIQKLPKIWGEAWAPQEQYIATQIILTALKYPPFKPEYLAEAKTRVQHIIEGKAEFKQASCVPSGMARSIWYTGAPLFLFQPGNRLVLAQGEFREIFMDGRPHVGKLDSNDPAIKYNGHSIGWWEGKDLVIDTVGVNPGHEIFYGVAYSGSNHFVERYELLNPQTLRVTVTVEAPVVLAEPWIFTKTYVTGPKGAAIPAGGGAGENGCDPNESRQKVDADGNVHLDLTPPPPGIR